MATVVFSHYPPVDELAGERLRAATVAWAPLLGELHAAGFRPYLELEMGDSDDPLRVFCELDNETLLDISIGDEGIPDAPVAVPESDWVVFVQSASGGYLAEVYIEATVDFRELANPVAGSGRLGRGGRASVPHRPVARWRALGGGFDRAGDVFGELFGAAQRALDPDHLELARGDLPGRLTAVTRSGQAAAVT
jgi:hypothetical protein